MPWRAGVKHKLQFLTLHATFFLWNGLESCCLTTDSPNFSAGDAAEVSKGASTSGLFLGTGFYHPGPALKKKALKEENTPRLESEVPAGTCRVQVKFHTCPNGAYNVRETESGLFKVDATALVWKRHMTMSGSHYKWKKLVGCFQVGVIEIIVCIPKFTYIYWTSQRKEILKIYFTKLLLK